MPKLHETKMGYKFFNHQMPELIKSINNLSENLGNNNEQCSIDTPAGKIVATSTDGDTAYPCVSIYLEVDGTRKRVAVVEYTPGPAPGIRTIAYNSSNDDYESLTPWKKGD